MKIITYSELPPVNEDEVLRYAGAAGDFSLLPLVRECAAELDDHFAFGVCYNEFPLTKTGNGWDLGFCVQHSASLDAYLDGCRKVMVFGATVGAAPDRIARKYARVSPVKTLLLSAVGTERIECLCDKFCADFAAAADGKVKPRFSPGYGDVPLEMQKTIFSYFTDFLKIGLTLNESLLMSPVKSVTALVGIY